MLLLVFSLALAVEYLFRRLILDRFTGDTQAAEQSGILRLWTILAPAIPEFMALGLFVGAAYAFYVLIYAEFFSGICLLYLSMQATIVSARTVSIVSKMFFSPANGNLRILPFNNRISLIGHRYVQTLSWLVAGGMMFVFLVERLRK